MNNSPQAAIRRFDIGQSMIHKKDFLGAIQQFRMVIDIGPVVPFHITEACHFNIGSCLYDIGDMRRAETHYRKCITSFLNCEKGLSERQRDVARIRVGTLLCSRGELQEAEQLFREVMKGDPEDVAARIGLARILNKRLDHNGAVAVLSDAVRIDQDRSDAYMELSKAHCKLSDAAEDEKTRMRHATEARRSINKAIKLDISNLDAQIILAEIIQDLFYDYATAKEHYLHIIRLSPDFQRAHMNLGVCLIQMNDFAAAEKALRKAVDIDPSDKKARELLGHLVEGNLIVTRVTPEGNAGR